jgi:cytochrome b
VLANALFLEAGSAGHVWVGYALAAILGLRLLWGLIGPAEARFSAFPPSPGRALAHIRQISAGITTGHRSHNPLGALMVYAIWSALSVIIATGIAMAGLPTAVAFQPATHAVVRLAAETSDEAGEATESGEGGENDESLAGEVHEGAVNVLYLLILLHIAGVVFESRRQRRNLVLAMLPGQG